MLLRNLAGSLALSAALAVPDFVQAQSLVIPRPEQRAIVVSVQMSMTFPGSTATPEEDSALQAKARAAFYAIASTECVNISKALNADCRPTQVGVNTRNVEVRLGSTTQAPPGVVVQGTMSFAVTPR